NIERLLRAIRPELDLPEDKKEEILGNLTDEAAAISSKDSAGPSPKTVLLQHPAKLAAAAVLIIGICAGAIWLLTASPKPEEQLATQPKDRFEETLPDKQKTDATPVAQQTDATKAASEIDLKRLAAMFETGNIKGLTAMLSDEAAEIRIAAANYLAQIGEFAAVEPLLNAGKEWTGPEADNPFVNAIYQIMLRMSRQQAEATVSEKEQQEPNEPRKILSPTLTAKETPKPSKIIVTYSGVVSNEASQPLEDVYIRSISYNKYMEFSGTEAEGWSDENGQFSVGLIDALDSDKVYRTLIFDHSDYAIGWFRTRRGRAPTDGLEINLLPPSVVAGTVIDQLNSPVEGAIVEAMVQVQSAKESSVLLMWDLFEMALTTDTKGQFAFNRIPDKARLHLLVNSAGYAPYSTQIEYAATDDFPIRAGQEDLSITLKPGGFIRGQLVMNGKPYEKEGVAIFVQGEKGYSVSHTDRTGQFETTGLAEGSYVIKALDDEFEKADLVSRMLTDVWVVVGREPTQVELVLGGGLPVTVSVIDQQTGDPARDVPVTAGPQGAQNITTANGKTNVKGQCILMASPGEYVIKAQGWKYGKLHDFSENITVNSGDEDLTVTIAITPRFMISGLLIDTGGKPVAGTVSLGSDSTATSNEKGKFELPQPGGDQMQVHIGFAFDETKQIGRAFFWQKSDDANDLELILEPVAIITGRVVFEDGTSVDQSELELWTRLPSGGWRGGGSKNPWKLNIIGNDEFEFENIPVGLEMDVHAEIPGFQGMANVGELIPGEMFDAGDVIIKPLRGFEDGKTEWTGRLKGRLLNENNEPMVGFRVDASIGTQQFSDVTDTQGRYTLTGLPEGKNISGNIYAAGYGHTIFEAVVDSNDLDIQMFPQGWDLLDKEAPGLFVEKWINTEPVVLEQYRGKVVLLQVGVLLSNYSRDLELTQRMIGKYADDGFEVIAVHQPLDATWIGEVTEADIAEYIARHNIIYPFGIDEDKPGNGATYSLYDVKAAPALYLIDKEGFVRISPKRDELDNWIDQLLAE
ncbi:MAG: hypothetical protein ACYS6I_03185, partial [Planctomycetota bacterium]